MIRLCFLVLATVLVLARPASAQAPATSAGLAAYDGPDRMQKILEAARKEGELSLYTSAPLDDIRAVTAAFEKKYGVKVTVWRASSERVLQRGVTEAKAGRKDVDVFETSSAQMEGLARESLLVPVRSPVLDDILPEARTGHPGWVGARLNVFTLAYNTKLVRKAELPGSFAALLEPRWKGRLGIEAEDSDWFFAVAQGLGEKQATRLFRDIVARNGISMRKGHSLLTNLVAAGEIPLALTVYHYKVEQLKAKGAPVDWFVIPPAIARINGVGVAAGAPHPNAALLWFDYELSEEGQKLLQTRDFVPTNRRIETGLQRVPLRYIDGKALLDDGARWDKLYQEIFGAAQSGAK